MSNSEKTRGRPDLVPVLKTLSLAQLSAYCSLVLERRAGPLVEPGNTRKAA